MLSSSPLKILQMYRSSESEQQLPIKNKDPKLHPDFSHSLSTSLCMTAKLIFVQAPVIYHKESICVMRWCEILTYIYAFTLLRFLLTAIEENDPEKYAIYFSVKWHPTQMPTFLMLKHAHQRDSDWQYTCTKIVKRGRKKIKRKRRYKHMYANRHIHTGRSTGNYKATRT